MTIFGLITKYEREIEILEENRKSTYDDNLIISSITLKRVVDDLKKIHSIRSERPTKPSIELKTIRTL